MITEDKDINIVGQALRMPSEFRYEGRVYLVFWGMDNIVDKSLSGITWVMLANNAIKVEHHFGIVLLKVSLDVHLTLGSQDC